jgi:hypothetical protein
MANAYSFVHALFRRQFDGGSPPWDSALQQRSTSVESAKGLVSGSLTRPHKQTSLNAVNTLWTAAVLRGFAPSVEESVAVFIALPLETRD